MGRRTPDDGPKKDRLPAEDTDAIRERVHRALARVPHAVGVNTQLNPRSGADFPFMREMLKLLRKARPSVSRQPFRGIAGRRHG